jgi:hypothetical protein
MSARDLRRAARHAAAVAVFCAAPCWAQWDPPSGDWLKEDPTDVRIMTWNILDNIRTNEAKTEGLNSWTSLTRIVASLKPDVLILQEVGDNGCSGCVDAIAELTTVFDLFLHGGTDPFLGGAVTSYVQAYDPAFDMPYLFVSNETDNFNRNVILSRFPFADLNGDTRSTQSDIPFVIAHLYAPGGDGGIRGFMFAELNLPDETYMGDLVIGNAHLKSGSAQADIDDRREAAQNVAYYIDYLLNGAGTGVPDPSSKILDGPAATMILGDNTPVVMGGDWNEDELTNGRKGPAEWLTAAEFIGSTDGTDRDRGDMVYDNALNQFNGSRATRSSSKLDYIAWQDSIATLRRAFIFNTNQQPAGSLPPELLSMAGGTLASGLASDHLTVVADLMLPLNVVTVPCDFDGDGDVDLADFAVFGQCFGGANLPPAGSCPPGADADFDNDGDVDLSDFATFSQKFTGAN